MPNVKFEVDGNTITAEQAGRYPIRVGGPGLKKNVIYVFDKQSAFDAWARTTAFADGFSRVRKAVSEAQRHENEDNSAALARRKDVTKRIIRDLGNLAGRTGLELTSKELFLKATTGSHLLEGPIIDSAVLYKDVDYSGSIFPIVAAVPYPWLPWFDDEASSVRGIGILLLREHPWWRGTWQWFVGNRNAGWYFEDHWLGDPRRFNDQASSAYNWSLV